MDDILSLMTFNVKVIAAQLEAAGSASVGLLKTLMVIKQAKAQQISQDEIKAACKLAGLAQDYIDNLLQIAADYDEEKPLG